MFKSFTWNLNNREQAIVDGQILCASEKDYPHRDIGVILV